MPHRLKTSGVISLFPGVNYTECKCIGVILQGVGEVHAEYPGHHGPHPHDEAPDLDEQTELDDLIPHAVQVGWDELVRVLDHVDEDLNFGFYLVKIRRHGAEKQLNVLFLSLIR